MWITIEKLRKNVHKINFLKMTGRKSVSPFITVYFIINLNEKENNDKIV